MVSGSFYPTSFIKGESHTISVVFGQLALDNNFYKGGKAQKEPLRVLGAPLKQLQGFESQLGRPQNLLNRPQNSWIA